MDNELKTSSMIISESKITNQSNCGNCLCCMNKQFNPFCFEQNKSVQLESTCEMYERSN